MAGTSRRCTPKIHRCGTFLPAIKNNFTQPTLPQRHAIVNLIFVNGMKMHGLSGCMRLDTSKEGWWIIWKLNTTARKEVLRVYKCSSNSQAILNLTTLLVRGRGWIVCELPWNPSKEILNDSKYVHEIQFVVMSAESSNQSNLQNSARCYLDMFVDYADQDESRKRKFIDKVRD